MDQRLVEASELRDKMLRLTASDGWAYLASILAERRANVARDVLLTPCAGVDAAFAQEYDKGRVAAYQELELLPQVLLDSATEVIEQFKSGDIEDAA